MPSGPRRGVSSNGKRAKRGAPAAHGGGGKRARLDASAAPSSDASAAPSSDASDASTMQAEAAASPSPREAASTMQAEAAAASLSHREAAPTMQAEAAPTASTTHEATKKIASFFAKYRGKFTNRIARRFLEEGPKDFQGLMEENTMFDQLAEDLRKYQVIEASGRLLFRIIQLCNWGRKGRPLITGTVNAKIYLAAYMIAAKPKNVFDEMGDLEERVIVASRPLIDAFHGLAGQLSNGASWKNIPIAREIPTLLCTYLRTFKDWKINDEKKLAGRLRRALQGIEETITKAREGQAAGETSSRDIEELEEQRDKLVTKLRQISGAGDAMGGGGWAGSVNAATVVITHTGGGLGAEGAGSVGAGMTNLQLAHELLIDGDFRLDDKAGMSDEKLVHTKIRDVFERAFWDSLVEDLSCDPPSYAPVLNVLSEIRAGIVGLSQNRPEAHQISEIIDVVHIKGQLREGALDFLGCVRLIDGIVAVIVSVHERTGYEGRREETLAKWDECRAGMMGVEGGERSDRARAICGALELALDRVHKIRVDIANNKLRAISPVIRQHGVEYEQTHFARQIASGAITMERTNRWIKHTVEQLAREKNPVVDVKSIGAGGTQPLANLDPAYRGVFLAALVNLIFDSPHWGGARRAQDRHDELPETMMLDLLRVKALNAKIRSDVLATIILVQVHQEVLNRVPNASKHQEIFSNVASVLQSKPPRASNLKAVVDLVVAEAARYMIESDEAATRNLIEKHVKQDHPIYQHVASQIKRAWFGVLTGTPYELKVPEMAKCMQIITTEHAKHLRVVADVNIRVHSQRYNEILGGIFHQGDDSLREVLQQIIPEQQGQHGRIGEGSSFHVAAADPRFASRAPDTDAP